MLALLGLALALATPRLTVWLDAGQARAALADLRAQLEAQPTAAFFSGRSRTLEETLAQIDLPAGWRVKAAAPIVYEANGMTAGGELTVYDGTQVLAHWRILAPTGRVEAVDVN